MSVTANDAVWRKVLQRMNDLRRFNAHVGVLASKGGSAQVPGTDITLTELAAIHEFGTGDGHIPERSFLRSTFYVRVADKLKSAITAFCKAVMAGTMDARKAVNNLGAWGAAEVKNTITQNEADQYGPYSYPPNADSTIAAKGSSIPLIGKEGQLLKSITWEVIEDK